MKNWIYIFMTAALGMLVFNLFQVNWEAPFVGKSVVACIGVLAASCALLLLVLLQRSILIAKKLKK